MCGKAFSLHNLSTTLPMAREFLDARAFRIEGAPNARVTRISRHTKPGRGGKKMQKVTFCRQAADNWSNALIGEYCSVAPQPAQARQPIQSASPKVTFWDFIPKICCQLLARSWIERAFIRSVYTPVMGCRICPGGLGVKRCKK